MAVTSAISVTSSSCLSLRSNAARFRHMLIQRVFEPLKICGTSFKFLAKSFQFCENRLRLSVRLFSIR